ncbi:MAG: hypothetical protein OEV43_05360 [Coriobacteriia bacterium]|nr:hypothetical protein [Coriobacteriia bacterium]
MSAAQATIASSVPSGTIDWLTESDNPAVATLVRRHLLGEKDSPDLDALWARRNQYAPVDRILEAMRDDGSWLAPERDYKKYEGSLWQIHFLGELYANPDDERVQRAVAYAFSRQLEDGSWSANGRPAGASPCLTANVGRALARMGHAADERIVAAIGYCAELYGTLGYLGCRDMRDFALNGYCHMVAPKILLLLGEVPKKSWPTDAPALRDACVAALRDKQIFRCLPREFKEFQAQVWPAPAAERSEVRERFLAEHSPLHYDDKPGWLRFGYPLSYNSDALEALLALAAVGETRRPEYKPALEVVRDAADGEMRWKMRTSFNGKMLADVEVKGKPSKWLTWRALKVLDFFG